MTKTLEQMVKKVEKETSKRNWEGPGLVNNSYVDKFFASSDKPGKRAIAYRIEENCYHDEKERYKYFGLPYVDGVSPLSYSVHSESINAYDGNVDLCIEDTCIHDRVPYLGALNILSMRHVAERKHEVVIVNNCEKNKKTYLVDFGNREVKLTFQEKL